MMFRVVIVGGPCGPYIDRCLDSLCLQADRGWTAAVVLDRFDDAPERVAARGGTPVTLRVNDKPKGALPNIIDSIGLQGPGPDDVIVTLDGDDWLNGNNVLGKVRRHYQVFPKLLMTYGSWIGYPDPKAVNNSAPYMTHEFENGTLRRGPWRGTHLRTFKYGLWQRVRDGDLRMRDGSYYDCAWDLAFMWPMLEMAGPERAKWIPDQLYVYNRETPYNDEKLRSSRQTAWRDEIAAKPPYTRLP